MSIEITIISFVLY